MAFVSPPTLNDPAAPTAALWNLVPTSGPQDEATAQLVDRLRSEVLPPVEEVAGVVVNVTGTVAVNGDFADYNIAYANHHHHSALTVATGRGPDAEAELAAFAPDVVHVHNTFPTWGTLWYVPPSFA